MGGVLTPLHHGPTGTMATVSSPADDRRRIRATSNWVDIREYSRASLGRRPAHSSAIPHAHRPARYWTCRMARAVPGEAGGGLGSFESDETRQFPSALGGLRRCGDG